jgi:sugar lactone lactonase YvrE
MAFDANGNMVDSFDKQFDNLFYYQHRMATNPWDPEQPVWICENGTNEIFKFSNDGKRILLRIGEHMKAGNDEYHFNGPNDIAFMPNGDFLIADGSRNRRIIRYSKDGKFISQFGRDGKGAQNCPDMAPGDFGNLHALAVDAKQRIYVGDWGGGRIQIFDQYGKFLSQWPGIARPSSISVSKDQKYVWVTDDTSNKILQYDMDGRLLSAWGTFGGQPGRMWGPHHLSVDSEGNLYVAEIYNGRAEKFRPRKGVDQSRLVGLLYKDHVN